VINARHVSLPKELMLSRFVSKWRSHALQLESKLENMSSAKEPFGVVSMSNEFRVFHP